MVQQFSTAVDIGARACQFCGDFRLYSFEDPSPQAREIAFAYDKLRLAELQRIVWKFATRRVVLRPIETTTMILVPVDWSPSDVYPLGSIVSYNDQIYVSNGYPLIGVTPEASTLWVPYFGPTTVNQWQSGTSYYAGELVYYPASESYTVYVSLENGNTDTPGAYPDWDATLTYNRGDTLMYQPGALLSEPGNIPIVSSTDGVTTVTSVVSGATGPWQNNRDLNLNTQPGVDAGWVLVSDTGQSTYRTGQKWLRLTAELQGTNIIYPLGVGPSTDDNTRNIYRLPNGYLKHAPDIQNPNEIMRVMGVLARAPSDAQFENGHMVTSEVQAVMLRFVADMTDVTLMDNLFCEGLAARLALDVSPVIVPREDRKETIARVARRYKDVIADARMNDAVERGASAQPQNQYVSVRF